MYSVRTFLSIAVFWGLVGLGCRVGATETKVDAQAMSLIRAAVRAHGSDRLARSEVVFQFRGQRFRMARNAGRYRYERWSRRQGRTIHDTLSNDGVTRVIDETSVAIPDSRKQSVSNGVNSVVYFASLPYPLLDPAVRARALGRVSIKGTEYDLVEVRFAQEGGGTDHDDVFNYWIRTDDHYVDYLAYRYHSGGGGVRFRVAYGRQHHEGVTFQHYENYEHDDLQVELKTLGALYEKGALNLLSKVETEVRSVRPPADL